MDNNIQKKKKTSKENNYINERNNFLNELNDCLGLTDDNNILIFNQINTDNNLKLFENKIKKYFKYGKWGYFRKQENNTKDLGTLIKNIYKHEKYTIYTKRITLKENDTKINATQLIFYKPGRIH